ncbi:MAG: outer membrane beta-barrel protein [Prevotella sp.]|nr:outer membrane beta-barrel protein [Prevotella sp.]
MKKLFLLAAMAVLGLQSQAQIVTSRSAMTTRQVVAEPKSAGWSTFGFEYLPSNFDPDHGDSESFTGFALNYTSATPLTSSIPIFLEWGIGAQWSHASDFLDVDDLDMNVLSVKVPINIMYDFEIPNTSINIDPYLGVRFRGNVWGQLKYDDDDWNVFDKDDMEDDLGMYVWKRFQIGWQIGVKARFSDSFFVGLGYGTDFSEISKKTKINETSISLGFVF